jgi:hypothetical protein
MYELGEILEVTEVEDMEQEIMDTDEYNLHLDTHSSSSSCRGRI